MRSRNCHSEDLIGFPETDVVSIPAPSGSWYDRAAAEEYPKPVGICYCTGLASLGIPQGIVKGSDFVA